MLYDILLKIDYEYMYPVANARHLLRVLPRTQGGQQRVIAAAIDLAPLPTTSVQLVDFFGNAGHAIQYRHEHEAIAITLKARVDRQATRPSGGIPSRLGELAGELTRWPDLGAESPLHFLAPSPRVNDVEPFRDFARAAVRDDMPLDVAVRTMSDAIRARMTFDDKATEVDTTPKEAFEKGRGVCQDYSHIMIACLRSLGVPAGYVSGFLRTIPPPGKERLPGSDAMHAWVRVWCGGSTGWLEYDPTNALDVADDHILVGYGRDYADVAPIRGVSRTAGGQKGKHTVDVIPLG